ncbi:MAG: helix-turn-helix domain-containing protein [Gammaproteobacteria bacterium]|nr:helix-turn-helix domain-containing protein [Gammaproteobacteria bacterium]MBU1926992.1 helix-turn-helix domain-containing protein [Gammaproteobacteria bacterium]MBU2546115.1 helix-turn-helix domain-containing protein [Gammaproteobacteria bacterium]
MATKKTEKTLKTIEKISRGKLTLGRLLWAIREGEGISQIDFAKVLKISKQCLCDLEHNRRTVGPKLAAKYAKELGYSKEQFIRLSLQDLVDRGGLDVVVDVLPRNKKRNKVHDVVQIEN